MCHFNANVEIYKFGKMLQFEICYNFRIVNFRIVTILELLHFSKFEMLFPANERTTAIICIDCQCTQLGKQKPKFKNRRNLNES